MNRNIIGFLLSGIICIASYAGLAGGQEADLTEVLGDVPPEMTAVAPVVTGRTDATSTLPNARPGECFAKVIIPPQYRTENVEVVEKEASEKIEVIPARYEWVEERILVKEATYKLQSIPPEYDSVEERIEVSPAYTVWTLGDRRGAQPAKPSLVSSAKAAGIPIGSAVPGQCYTEYYQPAQYRTESQRVLKKEASEKIVVSEPRYEWVEEKILVKEAGTKVIEVPAEYSEITEKVLVSPATTTWKKGQGLVERIDNTTGEIMCLIEVPAKYKTVKKRVLRTPATTNVVEIPAEYATQRVKKLVEPAREQRIPIAEEYVEVKKRMKVSDELLGWYGRGASDAVGESTGKTICLKEVPAEYKTVTKRVVKVPASTKKFELPAEYKTIKKHKLVAAAQERRIPVPATKKMITKKLKVSDERLEWRRVLCETNMSEGLITSIQRALSNRGYNPGPIDGVIGRQTLTAVEQFQLRNGQARGGLTMATIRSLGVQI